MHVRDYIEHLRQKPEHVRRDIAVGASAAVTALVAGLYLVSLASSGALALSPGSAKAPSVAEAASADIFSDLLGAAGAFRAAIDGTASPITIIETESDTTLAPSETGDGRTVIPF